MKDFWKDFIAGWLGGASGLVVGQPFDTVKVRLQTLSYSGAINCLVTSAKNETIAGLYKGMLAPIVSIGLLHSIYFSGYGLALQVLSTHHHDLPDGQNRLENPPLWMLEVSSCFGAALQWLPAVPVDVAKVQLQIQRENVGHFWQAGERPSRLSTGPWDCLRKLYGAFGLRGPMLGGGVHLARDVCGFALYLPVYVPLHRYLLAETPCGPTAASVLAGGVAGVTGWYSILPLDVIKSRLQAQNWQRPRYRNARHCALETWREGGVRAFFKGGVVLCVRAFPVNGVIFLVYSKALAAL